MKRGRGTHNTSNYGHVNARKKWLKKLKVVAPRNSFPRKEWSMKKAENLCFGTNNEY